MDHTTQCYRKMKQWVAWDVSVRQQMSHCKVTINSHFNKKKKTINTEKYIEYM